MKFAAERPFADPEKAARKLVEIANATEAGVGDGQVLGLAKKNPPVKAGSTPQSID
jgi:hypothetical protein